MFRSVVSILLLAVLLSACQVRVRQSTVVDEDGSGTLRLVLAVDQEFREALSTFGGQTSDDLFEPLVEGLPADFETRPYEEDGFEGVEIGGRFDSLADLESQLADVGADAGIGFPLPSITMEDDRFTYEAELPEFDTSDLEGIGSGTGFDVASLPLDDLFDIELSVRLPGDVVETNADEIGDDGTLIWRFGITDGPRSLRAVSEVSGFPWPVVAAGFVVAAVIAMLTIRRRRPHVDTPPADTDASGV